MRIINSSSVEKGEYTKGERIGISVNESQQKQGEHKVDLEPIFRISSNDIANFNVLVNALKNWKLSAGKVGHEFNSIFNLAPFLKEGVDVSIGRLKDGPVGISLSLKGTVFSVCGVPPEEFDGLISFYIEWEKTKKNEESLDNNKTDNELGLGTELNSNEAAQSDMLVYYPLPNLDVKKDEGEKNQKSMPQKIDVLCRIELIEIPFRVGPDPWSLWQEKEPPGNSSYVKKHTDLFGKIWSDTGKIVLAASQRGRSHAHEGKFRDDHFALKIGNSGDWSFFAVADGAGSAIYSREGSRIACEKFIEVLSRNFNNSDVAKKIDTVLQNEIDKMNNVEWDGFDHLNSIEWDGFKQCVHRAVYEVWNTIKQEANSADPTQNAQKKNSQDYNKPPRIQDYSTTLLGIALRHFQYKNQKKWVSVSYWIGDGGMAFWCPNGKSTVYPLGIPDGGEFAGQTRFITMSDEINPEKIVQRTRITILDDFEALVLMTDGLTDPFFPAEINLCDTKYWSEFWNDTLPADFKGYNDESLSAQQRAEALLKGLSFKVSGNHDDRTLLIVMNQNEKKN